MKMPIFFDESGDILVFGSKEDAQQYIEAIDVANGEYQGYDSEGRLLDLQLTDIGTVEIQTAELQPTHQVALKKVLVNFLLMLEKPDDQILEASLEELVTRMVKYQL